MCEKLWGLEESRQQAQHKINPKQKIWVKNVSFKSKNKAKSNKKMAGKNLLLNPMQKGNFKKAEFTLLLPITIH